MEEDLGLPLFKSGKRMDSFLKRDLVKLISHRWNVSTMSFP